MFTRPRMGMLAFLNCLIPFPRPIDGINSPRQSDMKISRPNVLGCVLVGVYMVHAYDIIL